MKNNSTALAMCLGAAAGPAVAQSTVEVFGIADMAVRYVQNGSAHQTLAVSGGNSTSRLGFRGTEDLGGGLKAGFWLESQVNVDDGTTAAKFWHRRSTLSLMGRLGEIRMGRDFSPAYRVIQYSDVFGDTGMGAGSGIYATTKINGQAYSTHTRLDNNIAYWSPEPTEGVYGSIAAAPGENVLGNRLVGAFVGFKSGPANVRAGYSATQVATGEVQHSALGLVYDFSGTQFMTSVSQLKLTTARERHFTVGAIVPVGADIVRVAYLVSEGKGGTFETDHQPDRTQKMALGYQYNLSKRTAFYSTAAYLRNKGGATYVVAAGPALGNGTTSKGVEVGMRHVF